MNKIKKILYRIIVSLEMAFLLVGILDCMGSSTDVYADEGIAKPNFTLKTVNGGTGVKIVIDKTKGADRYIIYFTEIDNAYSKYLNQDGKYNYNKEGVYDDCCLHEIEIKKDGSKKRSYTINGLPEGKYSFAIYADRTGEIGTASEEKSINIKAASIVKKEEKKYDFSNTKVGDIIKFGAYEQDDDMRNGKEDIEWIVLSKDNDKMLVVSRYVLDCIPFNKEKWEWRGEYIYYLHEKDNALKWLNEYFCKEAFTKKEQKMLKSKKFKNVGEISDERYSSDESKKIPGTNKKFKVFMLTTNDMLNPKNGFSTDKGTYDVYRRCAATPYAIAQGVRVGDPSEQDNSCENGQPACSWGVLNRNDSGFGYDTVSFKGSLWQGWDIDDGGMVYVYGVGIRPALYIKL